MSVSHNGISYRYLSPVSLIGISHRYISSVSLIGISDRHLSSVPLIGTSHRYISSVSLIGISHRYPSSVSLVDISHRYLSSAPSRRAVGRLRRTALGSRLAVRCIALSNKSVLHTASCLACLSCYCRAHPQRPFLGPSAQKTRLQK